ncbi:MAG: right-handed parallel beta-helix repeat-containing protein [candidate division Zixibacteria bacterium]|nr:right-handed parallel beta-helix repeat-containing protein [candidate division Zixibacteria bacterium]
MIIVLFAYTASSAAVVYVGDDNARHRGDGFAGGYFNDLQTAIDKAESGDTIRISPGVFHSKQHLYTESLCGNCENHLTDVAATRGFLIEGKSLTIVGSGADSTTLATNAGYGVLFLDSPNSIITSLKITGGKRDLDGNATDAAIVARGSRVTVSGCLIADNTDRPEEVVVGIGGVMGREGAELFIIGNEIFNNGWDGVALYRGATAVIADNVINGGRGAGIGITWDSNALAYRNQITNYWKGIGAFGESRAIVSNNLATDNLGWGIVVTGTAYMDVTNNIVANNGNCGMAIWSDECHGRFANNIVVDNGWREEWVCPPVGFWNNGQPDNFKISYNNIFGNKEGEYRDMPAENIDSTNISADPMFSGENDYHLLPGSPCLNTGDEEITDNDGSRSDIGLYGGPRAR